MDDQEWKFGDLVLVCGCIKGVLKGRTKEDPPSKTWWVLQEGETGLRQVHEDDLWRY